MLSQGGKADAFLPQQIPKRVSGIPDAYTNDKRDTTLLFWITVVTRVFDHLS